METDALLRASRLRREPYTLLFPLGVLLCWAGVLHWALLSAGWASEYRPRFHAMVQTQGFMTCLAVGFLFTMIPRRTGTRPPASWQVLVGALGPVLMAASAWVRNWPMAQFCWLVTALVTMAFVLSRFLTASATRRPPAGFTWIPLAFLMGIVGSALVYATDGNETLFELTRFGERLVQQGLLLGLVLGVGSLALPLMTRGEGPPDAGVGSADRLVRVAHLVGALALVWSFWLEVSGYLATGLLLRGLIVLVVLVAGPQIWRPATRQGLNARVILVAAWLLPSGYLVAAAMPDHALGAMHISLIGGFGLLGLAVSAQVILGHGGYREILIGYPPALLWMVTLVGSAIVARLSMELAPDHRFRWMGYAAVLLLVATLLWARLVAPGLLSPRSKDP